MAQVVAVARTEHQPVFAERDRAAVTVDGAVPNAQRFHGAGVYQKSCPKTLCPVRCEGNKLLLHIVDECVQALLQDALQTGRQQAFAQVVENGVAGLFDVHSMQLAQADQEPVRLVEAADDGARELPVEQEEFQNLVGMHADPMRPQKAW